MDGSDDATRTADEPAEDPVSSPVARLVAPLQIRDPERYDVLGEHGRGGLGKVARAHDKELGRTVAIKQLIKRGDIDELRFLREALITARLEHPSIVPIHEAGRWPDGTPFYVMKLVAGRSLKELLSERNTVEQRIALLHHVVAIADAIAYAHKRKIIHRDLKPANVIIGDFGETVVIDWGLAKDLSRAEDSELEPVPHEMPAFSDLTETGTVLGTPTYMAPEQFRGEAADQRADVYAIGAMLWELCSTSKVPPADPRHRDRLLRKAGIDHDLGAIVAKALSPDPEKRYRDADELVADLKAFTSGARIASRRYSVTALLAHWMRRHRALAIMIAITFLLATSGTIISVANIATARDRAETEQRRAESANAALVLENAELLMTRDPTAAVSALTSYQSVNTLRKQRLLAEARGRGVAEAVLSPHADTILFLAGDAKGALFSIGTDFRIRVTQSGVSSTLASDVAQSRVYTFSEEAGLLVYVTVRNDVALLDLQTRAITTLKIEEPYVMALSPDGKKLAAATRTGMLVVWRLDGVARTVYQERASEVWDIRFSDDDRVVVAGSHGLRSVALNGEPARTVTTHDARVGDVRDGFVLTNDMKGVVSLLSPELTVLATATPCRGAMPEAKFVPVIGAIAYACREGSVGMLKYDESSRSLLSTGTFSTDGPVLQFDVDASGRWVLAATKLNTIYVHDTVAKMTSLYKGHAARVYTLATPTKRFGYILSGDVNGAVRKWPLPRSGKRKIYHAGSGLTDVMTTSDSREVVIAGVDGVVRRIDRASGQITELPGHSRAIYKAIVAPEGLYSFSLDGTVRTWVGQRTRVFHDHGSVTEAAYHPFLKQMVSVGVDGRMFAWSMAGTDMTLLFGHDAPLMGLQVLSRNGHVVTYDRSGGLWEVTPGGVSKVIRPANGVPVTRLRVSPSGGYIAVATADGKIDVHDTTTWSIRRTMKVGGNVRQIAFDVRDRELLVASEDGLLHAEPLDARRLPWQEFPAHVRDVAYHPDGSVIGFVCADGSSWLYYVADDAWVYARDHDDDVLNSAFSADGSAFLSVDSDGVVIERQVFEAKQDDVSDRKGAIE